MSETQASLMQKVRAANMRAVKNETQTAKALTDAERKWQKVNAREAQLRAIRGELQLIAANLGKVIEGLDE